jgi:phosphoadenosine phosphosulfate reductase
MIQETLCYPLEEKIADSIETLKMYQPKDRPYMLAFSGGKDSCVIKELANMAGINYQAVYNPPGGIDPPELTRFIKKYHPDVMFSPLKEAMWHAVSRKGLPTRRFRWCYELYKETKSNSGDILILGVRAAESAARANRWKTVTVHTETKQFAISPILYWSDNDVWQFIRENNIQTCELYADQKRIGCVGCPMAHDRAQSLERYPAIKRQWQKGAELYFNRMKQTSQAKTYQAFNTWQEFYEWWLSDEPLPKEDECLGLLELWG